MTQALLFVTGLALLVLGGDWLVRGASRLALSFGLSPLVVGLTVVAFGTSAPEMAVSVGAAAHGQTDLALGNVIGSNIFNVLFILGLSALIQPLTVHLQMIRQEVPIMIGVTLLLMVLALDRFIGTVDGVLLLLTLVAYTVLLWRQSRSDSQAARQAKSGFEAQAAPLAGRRLAIDALFIVGGLGLLVFGADLLVGSAVAMARALGVSELVIGLTIVAAGTSLPEVAASVIATLRGERDIAVGNVVGSCIFNICGVAGTAAVVAGGVGVGALPVPPSVMDFDLWVLMAVTLACLPVFFSGRAIARWEGVLFLGYYAAYTAFLVMRAQDNGNMGLFNQAMLGFVLPLTVVTLVVSALPRRAPGN